MTCSPSKSMILAQGKSKSKNNASVTKSAALQAFGWRRFRFDSNQCAPYRRGRERGDCFEKARKARGSGETEEAMGLADTQATTAGRKAESCARGRGPPGSGSRFVNRIRSACRRCARRRCPSPDLFPRPGQGHPYPRGGLSSRHRLRVPLAGHRNGRG